MLGGQINSSGYLAYLERMASVYGELERIGHKLIGDPIADAVLDDALLRGPALERDLAFWRTRGTAETTTGPATQAYLAALSESADWAGLFVAHHYTRYLGDLSGGQAIGRIVARTYDLTDPTGIEFYGFDAIPKPKPYKDGYRERLDALALSPEDRARVVAEVQVAFRLNQAVFAELAESQAAYTA